MKIITLLFLCLNGLNLMAQETMTIREVFDFNVGDKFHLTKNNQTPNAERLTIIGKTFSDNMDTVFYKIARNNYYSVYTLNNEPYVEYFIKIDTVQVNYANLDSSIFTYISDLQYDTLVKYNGMNFTYDTIRISSPDFCDRLVNGFDCSILTSANYHYSFGKGLGIIKEYIEYEESGGLSTVDKSLKYYNIAGSECGTPDTWTGVFESIADDLIKIYPNPVSQNLYFELKNPNNCAISLFDMKGALVRTVNASDNFEMNVSDLPKGIYLINLNLGDKVLNKKIMIR